MWTLTNQSLNAIETDAFIRRCLVLLMRQYPQLAAKLSEDTHAHWLKLLAAGTAKAREYDLVVERDIYQYLQALVVFGADFDSKVPALQAILAAQKNTPAERATKLGQISVDCLAALGNTWHTPFAELVSVKLGDLFKLAWQHANPNQQQLARDVLVGSNKSSAANPLLELLSIEKQVISS
jgi:hypothetical protein